MPNKKKLNEETTGLDELIEEITVDAYGDDEQLWAFRQVIENEIGFPVDGFIIDEPVRVIKIDYDGNERRGLTATCKRENGSKHVVTAADVRFPRDSTAGRYLAAYRKWVGLQPYPSPPSNLSGAKRRKVVAGDVKLKGPLDLVPLSVKQSVARCRPLGTGGIITFRAPKLWKLIPGEVVTVQPRKQWSYGGNPYLSGDIIQTARHTCAGFGTTSPRRGRIVES